MCDATIYASVPAGAGPTVAALERPDRGDRRHHDVTDAGDASGANADAEDDDDILDLDLDLDDDDDPNALPPGGGSASVSERDRQPGGPVPGAAGTGFAMSHAAASGCDRCHVYEYHVVFDPGYSVPVLYFNATTLDGNPITGDAIWDSIQHACKQQMQAMAAFTQTDHPILGRPFFQLHPCRTAELMAALTALGSPAIAAPAATIHGSDGQPRARASGEPDPPSSPSSSPSSQQHYVKAWISLMGPAVGLRLSHTYYGAL